MHSEDPRKRQAPEQRQPAQKQRQLPELFSLDHVVVENKLRNPLTGTAQVLEKRGKAPALEHSAEVQ
jgi:hypothetical protein